MRGAGSKNAWALFLLILAGIVLGGFIGLVVITFGLTIKITIASIIGVIISIFIYRFL